MPDDQSGVPQQPQILDKGEPNELAFALMRDSFVVIHPRIEFSGDLCSCGGILDHKLVCRRCRFDHANQRYSDGHTPEPQSELLANVRPIPTLRGGHCSCGGTVWYGNPVCNRCCYDYEQEVFLA
ncbi:MAG: hypothetical protein Q8O32_01665 [bacterium]|nr:hypothetical protein [bacterium]